MKATAAAVLSARYRVSIVTGIPVDRISIRHSTAPKGWIAAIDTGENLTLDLAATVAGIAKEARCPFCDGLSIRRDGCCDHEIHAY